ncbi:ssDNA endodeoxyribonuclease RAD1 [Sporobolomyces koalae]|uniref:ssDNA endodeoxyribonuclease RAD1 n=1 Tax=Sporobolomyces koalae TaxID=500713 RepID=UPI003170AAD3
MATVGLQPPNAKRKKLEDAAALLPYQRSILSQLIPQADSAPASTDSMVIMARGLGLRTVVTNFLKVYDMPEKLVFLLNASPDEERGFAEEVGMRMKIVGYDMPEATRQKLYKDGGLFSISSTILITDMLRGSVPVDLVTGMVVLHAESVTPTSQEAFVVGIYRKTNKTGFLKAFSDQPEAFTFGLSPLQTILMQLKLREVVIYPRFHDEVDSDLKKRKADVIEFYQPLTPRMLEIQNALLDCMEATISEIKRSNHYLEVDDLTVENALFRSFDSLVRAQLDQVWHKVGPKTKGLVSDLTTLRKLQTFLLSMDSVRYLQYLETLLSSYTPTIGALDRKERPAWLGTPAADTIFKTARERVYRQKRLSPADKTARDTGIDGEEIPTDLDDGDWTKTANSTEDDEEELLRYMEEQEEEQSRKSANKSTALPAPKLDRPRWLPPGVERVLEEQPKWLLLSEVLEEIESQMHWAPVDSHGYSSNTILVMCNSSADCHNLGTYLSETKSTSTGQDLLESNLKSYFYWKAHISRLTRSLKKSAGLPKTTATTFTTIPEVNRTNPSTFDSAARRRPGDAFELSAALKRKDAQRGSSGSGPPTKRRRVRGGGGLGAQSRASSSVEVGSGAMFEAATGANPDAFEEDAEKLAKIFDSSGNLTTSLETPKLEEEAFNSDAFEEFFGLISQEDLVVIRPYLGDEDDRVLEELRPKYVVMFDPNPAFVRRIEAYRAAHQGLAVRIYFLVYKDSIEEQKYLSSIRKEKDAFVRLIQEKGSMAIPHEAEYRPSDEDAEVLRTFSSSRIGGAKGVSAEPMKVIVDIREFRSSLPGLLHAGKFEVVPVTLSIGDYIITPDMSVERKSIPDLISSFNSGRLYQQCELMTAHYKQPVLLIEFDEKKSFNLDTYEASRPRSEAANAADVDLRAKLVLLTITFPKLRIIWSSSPYQTVEIFRELKASREEPDERKAVLVGLDEDSGGVAAEGTASGVAGEAGFNLTPQEMLRSLPGLTSSNYRHLSAKVTNMEELAKLDLNELQQLIGNEPGKKLHDFITSDHFFLG